MVSPNPSSPPALIGHVPAPLAGGEHVLRCPLWDLSSHLQFFGYPGWHEMRMVWHYGKCVLLFFLFFIYPTHTCLIIQRFQFACCQLDPSDKRLHYLVIGGLSGCRASQWINVLFNRCNVVCSSCQHSQNCTWLKLNTGIACCVFYSCVILAVDLFYFAWPGFNVL